MHIRWVEGACEVHDALSFLDCGSWELYAIKKVIPDHHPAYGSAIVRVDSGFLSASCLVPATTCGGSSHSSNDPSKTTTMMFRVRH